MTAAILWDTRTPRGFCIEMEASRYMRAVGPAAWSVYTFLIQCAAQAGRPTSWPPLAAIADQCGLAEPEVRHAIRQLSRYGLLKFTEERRADGDTVVRICRIVGMGSDAASVAGQTQPLGAEDVAEEIWARALDEGAAMRSMFDALAEACGYDRLDLDDAAREQIFAALSVIRSAGGDSEQIREAAGFYRWAAPDLPLTPRNLALAWDLLKEAAASAAPIEAE